MSATRSEATSPRSSPASIRWRIASPAGSSSLTGSCLDSRPTRKTLPQGVVSYSFTDGHQTLTQANSTGAFALAVHPDVAIDLNCCWSVFINTPTSGITTTMSSDRYDHAWIGADNASDARPSGRW